MSNFIPNSFQIPNALIDDLIADISPNALKCYLVIARKTVGWNKEWDLISTTQLMEITGIKKKQTVYAAISELEDLRLIESLKETGKITKYRLKVVPEKVVTKNGTSTENSNEVVPKIDTGTSTENGYSTKDNIKTNITKEKYIQKENENLKIKPKDLINFYKENISPLQSKIKEMKSINALALCPNAFEKILVGLKNYANDLPKDKFHITNLENFIKEKIYLDYQEPAKRNTPINSLNISGKNYTASEEF